MNRSILKAALFAALLAVPAWAGVETYSTTPASNTALFPENMLPSAVNDGMRQVQADLRAAYNSAEWIQYGDGDGAASVTYNSATSFLVNGANVTTTYHAGRRVKAVGSATGTIYGTISSSSFSTNTTVNVTWDSGSLSNEALTISIGILSKDNDSLPSSVLKATASTTEVLTGTNAAKATTPDAVAALWEQGADVASAGTISLGEGGYFNITGTTTITDIDFATDKTGRRARLKFAGALTLTHNATTLILPGGANITTAAGDVAEVVSEGSDAVRVTDYQRANGQSLVGDGSGDINALTTTDNPASTAFVEGSIGAGASNNRKFRVGEVGGWVPLEEATASGSATLDFVLTSYLADFEDFQFRVSNILPAAAAGAHMWIRTSTNGGGAYDAGASNYAFIAGWKSPGVGFSDDNSSGATEISVSGTTGANVIGDTSTKGMYGSIDLFNPSVAAHVTFVWELMYQAEDGDYNILIGQGRRISVADVDAVQFLMSTGNIASGKITLMGRRKVQ